MGPRTAYSALMSFLLRSWTDSIGIVIVGLARVREFRNSRVR